MNKMWYIYSWNLVLAVTWPTDGSSRVTEQCLCTLPWQLSTALLHIFTRARATGSKDPFLPTKTQVIRTFPQGNMTVSDDPRSLTYCQVSFYQDVVCASLQIRVGLKVFSIRPYFSKIFKTVPDFTGVFPLLLSCLKYSMSLSTSIKDTMTSVATTLSQNSMYCED